MGMLWDLYQEWRDHQEFPPSQRRVATRLGMSPTAFGNWQSPMSRLPDVENLVRFSLLVRAPYTAVVDAALHDAGYLPRPEVVVASTQGGATTGTLVGPNDRVVTFLIEDERAGDPPVDFEKAEAARKDALRVRSRGQQTRDQADDAGEENQDT